LRAALILAAMAACAAEVPSEARIGNRFLERRFQIREGRLATTAFLNNLDHRVYAAEAADEFELEIVWERLHYQHGLENPVRLTARDFTVRDVVHRAPSGGAQRLTFVLANERHGLEVRVVFRLGPDDPFLRKHLEIRSPGADKVFLNRIAVETFGLRGVDARLGGFGQPLYADNLFVGLEYPASYNITERNQLRCYYYSGATTGKEWLRTEPAVVGVATDGAVRRAFLDYISQIRAGKVRFTTVFNTWYDMQRDTLTEANCLERMATLRRKLLDPFNIRLDSFVLDDGWDDRNSVWAIHPGRFAGGFGPLQQKLSEDGARLGLWFGPIGGYEERQLRIAAGRREGYEITANGEYFCLAGTKYREKLKQRVLDLVRAHRVNHLKFDGVPYGCNAPGHGHLPGIHSREAHVRALLDILASVRAADRNIFLNIKTGNWLSPWWLKYADVVFMGGQDYGFLNNVPAISERDKAITYRDKVLYDDFRRYEYQFPQSSIMTIGIIKGTLGSEGGLGESLESWMHTAIMNFSRGSMLTELYVSPGILTDGEWDALGQILVWARENSNVLLADTRFIGGDPGLGQPYGYAHFADNLGIITVRNPSIEPREVSIVLDRSAGLEPTGARLQARVIFPYNTMVAGAFRYGDTLELDVQGYQVVVMALGPIPDLDRFPELPQGVRYGPAFGSGGTHSMYIPSSSPAGQVSVDALRLSRGSGAFALRLPAGVRNPRLALLAKPAEKAPLAARLRNNGLEQKLQAVSPESTERWGEGEGRWVFFVTRLSDGENRLEFEVSDVRETPFSGELGAWLLGDFPLMEQKVELSAGPPPATGLLPAFPAWDYRTIHLFSRRFE